MSGGGEVRLRFPRIPHLPWSPGRSADDRVLQDLTGFDGRRIIVTEKLDGENTTLGCGYMHARSPNGRDRTATLRESRSWLRAFHAAHQRRIPEGHRWIVENLYARHSISYHDLPGWGFLLFVFGDGRVLDHEWTEQGAREVGLCSPPVIYVGYCDWRAVTEAWEAYRPQWSEVAEGYVVRACGTLLEGEFATRVAKFVRAGHVQTDQHWTRQRLVRNEVAR